MSEQITEIPVFDSNINQSEIQLFKSVNKSVFEKLKSASLLNVRILSDMDWEELLQIGITKDRAIKIINEARDNLFCSFVTAGDYLLQRASRKKLRTKVDCIDRILGGGFETQALTEIHGEFASGKTQMCHHLCVTAQLETDSDSLASSVIFLDTEQTFRPQRLDPICRRFGLSPDSVRANIYHNRPDSVDKICHLMTRLVSESFESITGLKTELPPRFLIIDSVIKFFRAEYLGRGTLADRQQRLSGFLNDCQKFATKQNAVVILINQVTANPDALFGPTLKPVGGNILGHAATYRISLKKKAGVGNRTLTIVDAPDLPPMVVPFVITNEGISEDDSDSDK